MLKRNGDNKPCPECRKDCRPWELAKEESGHRHICDECRAKAGDVPVLVQKQAS